MNGGFASQTRGPECFLDRPEVVKTAERAADRELTPDRAGAAPDAIARSSATTPPVDSVWKGTGE
jgi:hypothetical protein